MPRLGPPRHGLRGPALRGLLLLQQRRVRSAHASTLSQPQSDTRILNLRKSLCRNNEMGLRSAPRAGIRPGTAHRPLPLRHLGRLGLPGCPALPTPPRPRRLPLPLRRPNRRWPSRQLLRCRAPPRVLVAGGSRRPLLAPRVGEAGGYVAAGREHVLFEPLRLELVCRRCKVTCRRGRCLGPRRRHCKQRTCCRSERCWRRPA